MRYTDTGRSRGFAFVEMSEAGEAAQAIVALNGTVVDDRKLNVKEAPVEPAPPLRRVPRL